MKKWKASMQETFEDLPHNVSKWRAALQRASQTLEQAWETAAAEHRFPGVGLMRGNQVAHPGFGARKA